MAYRPFCLSRIGASHVKRGLPCQDYSEIHAACGIAAAVAADGHGNRRHFRSDKGAEMACKIALNEIFRSDWASIDPDGMEVLLDDLKLRIVEEWERSVRADLRRRPFTEEELEEAKNVLTEEQYERLTDGRDVPVAYGSTLLAAITFPGGWAAIQIGDGACCLISADGSYSWPMPESLVNEGNRTASLCMPSPMREFRHCFGEDLPAALIVYTDGIEKVFPSEGKEVMSLLHWIFKNELSGGEEREDNLKRTLDRLTGLSPAGDDLSAAGLINTEAEDHVPKQDRAAVSMERERIRLRLLETENTIAYNRQRLSEAEKQDGTRAEEIVRKLREILHRKEEEAEQLKMQLSAFDRERGEETDEVL
ncbi:MAG: protein phosphatase 2C domain-containing protein [Lachnospiraceae bacterium]|nr:protein phosphatase 2C domain-containing protein [Lachnospiraceae bacterium]